MILRCLSLCYFCIVHDFDSKLEIISSYSIPNKPTNHYQHSANNQCYAKFIYFWERL